MAEAVRPDDDVPKEHVQRPEPPWRQRLYRTECGRPVSEFAVVLTREQLQAKVQKQGIQRAALSTCYTCLDTWRRHDDWDHSPSAVVARDCQYRTADPGVDDEFRALAALVDNHREEFEAELAALRSAVKMDSLRLLRERRRREQR